MSHVRGSASGARDRVIAFHRRRLAEWHDVAPADVRPAPGSVLERLERGDEVVLRGWEIPLLDDFGVDARPGGWFLFAAEGSVVEVRPRFEGPPRKGEQHIVGWDPV